MNLLLHIITFIFVCSSITYEQLNYELQILHDDFLTHFQSFYPPDKVRSLNHWEVGDYLFLLAKMYLYGIMPSQLQTDSPYLLAYHYLKTAAYQYEMKDAYYYLTIIEFMKLVPTTTIKRNLEDQQSKGNKDYLQMKNVINYMNSSHLNNVEHDLYLSSLLGHRGATLTLAYMLKEGIGMEKNCSASLSYYLYSLKQQKIDTFEFPSEYVDDENFQKYLYAKKKVDYKYYGDDDISALLQTDFFDDESTRAYEELASNYDKGQNGFLRNHTKAFQIYQRIADAGSKRAKIKIGHYYLRGQGTNVNHEKAKEYFESIEKNSEHAEELLTVMKYFSLGFKNKQPYALKKMQLLFEKYEKELESSKQDTFTTSYFKYLVSTLVVAGEIKGEKENGIRLMEEAAHQGNIQALSSLGIIFADGSDISYDCKRATQYFSDQSYSRYLFQEKIQIAKIGFKKDRLMFSLIKYMQLIMIGYSNAYINAFYLLKVYGDEVLKLTQRSWSLVEASTNQHYKLLKKMKYVPSLEKQLLKTYNPEGKQVFDWKNLQKLMMGNQNTIEEYAKYIKKKIITLGIKVKKIKFLQFYEQDPLQIQTLSELANQNGNSAYILESRFLLGKYYQNEAVKQTKQVKQKIAMQEYKRATKSPFFANIIFLIEGGSLPQSNIFSDLLMYLSMVMMVGIFFYWKKSRRLEEVLLQEVKKAEEKQEKEKEEEKERLREQEQMIERQYIQKFGNRGSTMEEVGRDLDQPQITEEY